MENGLSNLSVRDYILVANAIIIPVIVWYKTKRHYQKRNLKKADLQNDNSSLNNIEKHLDIYERLLDDVVNRHTEEKKALEEIIVNLRKEIAFLQQKNS